ncbi:MAG: hypothetical protein ABG776_15115 [Cyanobacteria bacterium J06555_13]
MSKLLESKSTNYLPFVVLGTAILQLSLIILFISHLKPTAMVAQLENGCSIPVTPITSKERDPAVITYFTKNFLFLMFNWSVADPAHIAETEVNPEINKGKEVSVESEMVSEFNLLSPKGWPVQADDGSTSKNVTSSSWYASYALSEDFRGQFLQKVAEITPKEVFTGDTEVAIKIREILPPQAVGKGKWKVNVLADLVIVSGENTAGVSLPFDKEVYVRTVIVPDAAFGTTPFAQAIYSLQQSGLEIYAIKDIQGE